MTLELEVTCELCGQKHVYPMSAAGRYEGPAACDASSPVSYCVKPDTWRRLVEAMREQQVH